MVKPFSVTLDTMEKWSTERVATPFYNVGQYRGFRSSRNRGRRRTTSYAVKLSKDKTRKVPKWSTILEIYGPRLGKVLVTLFCTGSCMYFLINFFLLYWEYQTVVNVLIDFPDKPELPGITVCVENLRKRVGCDQSNADKNCNDIKKLAKNTKSKAFEEYLATKDIELIKSMAPTIDEIFIRCELSTEVSERDTDICNKSIWLFYKGSNCYAMWNRWYKPPNYHTIKTNDSTFQFVLAYDPDDYYNTDNPMIAEIFIHGRKAIPGTRTQKFEAAPNTINSIGVTRISVNLMEAPYKTMCQKYEKARIINGVQVLSEELCFLECSKRYALFKCWCIPNCLQLITNENKCSQPIDNHHECCGNVIANQPRCHQSCPVDCKTMLYDITVDSDLYNDFDLLRETLNESYNNSKFARIEVNLQLIRHIQYNHAAKITPIEILGYVGGYLGIWLGVSIPWFYDTIVNGLKYLQIRFISTVKKKIQASANSLLKIEK